MGEHGNAIACPQVTHARTSLRDDRGKLVPDHLRELVGGGVQRPAGVLVQVGAADPAPLRQNAELAGGDRIRFGHLIDAQVPVSVQPHRQHADRLRSAASEIASATVR